MFSHVLVLNVPKWLALFFFLFFLMMWTSEPLSLLSHVLPTCHMGVENPNLGLLACKAGDLLMESFPSPFPKVLMVFGNS